MKHIIITTIAAVLLVGCGGPSVDIHEAVSKGNIEAVKQHIAAGTDLNVKGDRGITPLLVAVMNGHKEITELLIAEGADVNAQDNDAGWAPLHAAARKGLKPVVELLIAAGADVNAKDDSNITPLL